MRKFKMRGLALVLITVLLLVVGCGKSSEAPKAAGTSSEPQKTVDSGKVYKIRIASVLAEGAAQSKGLIAWAKELEKRTNGQVKVEQMTWNGALLKPDNYLEGLRDRVVDVAFISQQYHPTKTPISAALQPVFINDLIGSGPILMDIYNSTPELKEEWMKWNVIPVAWFPGADFPLMTNFKFDSMDALKGKKLRAIGAQVPLAVKNWGGIPVNVSSADTYGALEKGTVDGIAGFPAYGLQSNKIGEIAKQVTDFRYSGQSCWFGIGFNKEAYNELPDNIKKIITDLGPYASEVADKANAEDAIAGYKLARQSGANLVQLTPEAATKFQQLINPPMIWEEGLKGAEAAGFKNARQVMDKMVKALKDNDTKNPHKTLMEQFFDTEKAGK